MTSGSNKWIGGIIAYLVITVQHVRSVMPVEEDNEEVEELSREKKLEEKSWKCHKRNESQ